MNSGSSSSKSDKPASRSRKPSSKCWLSRCFSQASFSDTDLDSDSEYVIVNHSVFKIPRNSQAASNEGTSRSLIGTDEARTIIVQRGSEKKVSTGYNKKYNKKTSSRGGIPDRKGPMETRRHEVISQRPSLDEKIYQYIRMKTYEKMNPYEMSPNDFLNNISSVFVDNIKDPIPKDPLNRPKIFNRYNRRRRKTDAQIMYEKAKEREREQIAAERNKHGHKSSDVHTLRRASVNPTLINDINKNYTDESLNYKAAIEKEEKDKEYEYDEKVLIWKIVVSNDEDEGKE